MIILYSMPFLIVLLIVCLYTTNYLERPKVVKHSPEFIQFQKDHFESLGVTISLKYKFPNRFVFVREMNGKVVNRSLFTTDQDASNEYRKIKKYLTGQDEIIRLTLQGKRL